MNIDNVIIEGKTIQAYSLNLMHYVFTIPLPEPHSFINLLSGLIEEQADYFSPDFSVEAQDVEFLWDGQLYHQGIRFGLSIKHSNKPYHVAYIPKALVLSYLIKHRLPIFLQQHPESKTIIELILNTNLSFFEKIKQGINIRLLANTNHNPSDPNCLNHERCTYLSDWKNKCSTHDWQLLLHYLPKASDEWLIKLLTKQLISNNTVGLQCLLFLMKHPNEVISRHALSKLSRITQYLYFMDTQSFVDIENVINALPYKLEDEAKQAIKTIKDSLFTLQEKTLFIDTQDKDCDTYIIEAVFNSVSREIGFAHCIRSLLRGEEYTSVRYYQCQFVQTPFLWKNQRYEQGVKFSLGNGILYEWPHSVIVPNDVAQAYIQEASQRYAQLDPNFTAKLNELLNEPLPLEDTLKPLLALTNNDTLSQDDKHKVKAQWVQIYHHIGSLPKEEALQFAASVWAAAKEYYKPKTPATLPEDLFIIVLATIKINEDHLANHDVGVGYLIHFLYDTLLKGMKVPNHMYDVLYTLMYNIPPFTIMEEWEEEPLEELQYQIRVLQEFFFPKKEGVLQ